MRAGPRSRPRQDALRAHRRSLWPRTLFALLLVLPAAVVAGATPNDAADHRGARQQWQPTLPNAPHDARLDQRLTLDIVGRAAVPALAILSKKTGVSLAVAPEDLKTVGERKLTIFARKLELRGLMVQIPEALQECHWDIVEEGGQTKYLLHRNTNAQKAIAWLSQRAREQTQTEGQPGRLARVEATLRALAMTPEELKELEQTDLPLARSVQDPETRPFLDAFASLSDEDMGKFIDTGGVSRPFGRLSGQTQQVISDRAKRGLERNQQAVAYETKQGNEARARFMESQAGLAKAIVDNVATSTLDFQDNRMLPGYEPSDPEILYHIVVTPQANAAIGTGDTMVRNSDSRYLEELLVSTGTPRSAAHDAVAQCQAKARQQRAQRDEAQRRGALVQVPDAEVRMLAAVSAGPPLELAEAQKLFAEQRDVSVVADFFSDAKLPYAKEAAAQLSLSQLLAVLAKQWNLKWQKAGSCLIFRHANWFDRIPSELSESLITRLRRKLQTKGQLSLDDAAEVSLAVSGTHWQHSIPEDLQDAGLTIVGVLAGSQNLWRLYSSLSLGQVAQAGKPEGLSYSAMTASQKQQASLFVHDAPDKVSQLRYCIRKSTDSKGTITCTLGVYLKGEKLPKQSTTLRFPKAKTGSRKGSMTTG